jgi:D-serine deaminase-like pyridoxal phosphate-dependent protein
MVSIYELETPIVVVDLDKLNANSTKLPTDLDAHGIANRPHIKTHTLPEIAWMQLRAGAVGITVQKLGEAEVMAQAGIQDIFMPYNIVGAAKLERLMALARRVRMSVTADSEFTVRGLSAAAQAAGLELPVQVEFDGGLKRCGVQSPQEAADLARIIARAPGLRFGGLMTFPSNAETGPFVRQTRALLVPDGIPIPCVSGGGTPGMWQVHTYPEVTEHRAGTYVFGDRHTLHAGSHQLDEVAFTVHATVVSRPTADRGILDAAQDLGLDIMIWTATACS